MTYYIPAFKREKIGIAYLLLILSINILFNSIFDDDELYFEYVKVDLFIEYGDYYSIK